MCVVRFLISSGCLNNINCIMVSKLCDFVLSVNLFLGIKVDTNFLPRKHICECFSCL